MAFISAFLEEGDSNSVAYEDTNWQIREHCNRGYEPWFTLHKRRRFIGLAWWSGLQKWGDYTPLHDFVMRWNEWPKPRHEGPQLGCGPSRWNCSAATPREITMDTLQLLRLMAGIRPMDPRDRDLIVRAADEIELHRNRAAWLQEQAEKGCVTMCFELDGGVHVTLDPAGEEQRAARNVGTISEGIDQLMTPNTCVSGCPPTNLEKKDHD